ncbi:MAG TPA: hypothetical protein VEI03_23815 [Stellaceae bacterium]|nr:hypothetical protein [Stellaceae bacterium]
MGAVNPGGQIGGVFGSLLFQMLLEEASKDAAATPEASPPLPGPRVDGTGAGSYAATPPWNPSWISPGTTFVTLDQKSMLLNQMRPLATGSYAATDPSSPATTSDVEAQKSGILGLMRPLDATSADGTGGAGIGSTAAAPLQTQKAAMLQNMRPLNGEAAKLDGSDEAISDRAQVPFDKAVPNSANSAANQLCQAAGAGSGCIGTFNPRGTGSVAAGANAGTETGTSAVAAGAAVATGLAAGQVAAASIPPPPSSAGDASPAGQPCYQIIGYKITPGALGDNNVDSQLAPCDPVQSQPAIGIPSVDGVTESASVVTSQSLATEVNALQRDICARLPELRKRLAGYEQALKRLQATATTAAAERREWEDRWTDTGKEAFEQLPGGLLLLLDVRADGKLKALDEEIGRALNSRINATDRDIREQYDIAFKALEAQRRKILSDKTAWIKHLGEASGILDTWKLAENRDQWDRWWSGLNQLLQMSLDDEGVQHVLKIGSGYGRALAVAKLWADASYDLFSEYASWRAIEEINRASEDYLRAVNALQKRIKKTMDEIRNAEAELRSMTPSPGACASAA